MPSDIISSVLDLYKLKLEQFNDVAADLQLQQEANEQAQRAMEVSTEQVSVQTERAQKAEADLVAATLRADKAEADNAIIKDAAKKNMEAATKRRDEVIRSLQDAQATSLRRYRVICDLLEKFRKVGQTKEAAEQAMEEFVAMTAELAPDFPSNVRHQCGLEDDEVTNVSSTVNEFVVPIEFVDPSELGANDESEAMDYENETDKFDIEISDSDENNESSNNEQMDHDGEPGQGFMMNYKHAELQVGVFLMNKAEMDEFNKLEFESEEDPHCQD